MNANPFLGVLLHALGGFAAGSFYIPYKKVRGWAWESYWITGGLFSWILAPWIVAWATCPNPLAILRDSPSGALIGCYIFGVLWGIGGLTFGLSMRYLGMSLGYALALGFCAAFGTLVPPAWMHEMEKFHSFSGLVILAGVAVCLLGIAICGVAGIHKEKEQSADQKQATIKEFNFSKGLWVAIFAGIMSAFMGIAMATVGKPIADAAIAHGTPKLFSNTPMHIVIMAGGFTTNFLWCGFLNLRNRTMGDYLNFAGTPVLLNVFFAALAGITWYLQFMFYGMGTTQMGRYDFSSWTLHMAFIIVFSNLWGILFKEWRGSSRHTRGLVTAGLLVLVFSTLVVGMGSYIDAQKKPAVPAPTEQTVSQAQAK